MIRYDIIKGYRNESFVYEMLLKRNKTLLVINHNIGSGVRYNIIKGFKPIFSTNDKYAIKLWMDLNGMKIGIKAYILIKDNKNCCLIELKINNM